MNLSEIISYLTKDIKNQSSQKLQINLSNSWKNNRVYSRYQRDKIQGFKLTYYSQPLIYAGEPYFCPNGWKRYSLDVGMTNQQFSAKYKDWPVAYHGTSSEKMFSIISTGFKSFPGCWIPINEKAVYLTPSIVYASHPRYAKIQFWKNMHIQVILQVRVKKSFFMKKAGTLKNAKGDCPAAIDLNYSNKQLQWVCKWNKQSLIQAEDGILVYGIMLKMSAEDPKQIPQNDWYALKRVN